MHYDAMLDVITNITDADTPLTIPAHGAEMTHEDVANFTWQMLAHVKIRLIRKAYKFYTDGDKRNAYAVLEFLCAHFSNAKTHELSSFIAACGIVLTLLELNAPGNIIELCLKDAFAQFSAINSDCIAMDNEEKN